MSAVAAPAPYKGAPWRSLFLRAPKYAHQLVARDNFCALGELASVRLGLKTGNDGFFYLRTAGAATALTLERSRSRRILVSGLNGWEGSLQSADLRPAVLNPHQLWEGEGQRQFTIPTSTGIAYLLPRDRAATGELAAYISLGEAQSVHEGPLVRSNGTSGRWWRQARAVANPPWVLPYNSAYDYGAWDNPSLAVINGRFVGVMPADGVDSELLGAALNTSMVILTRLLEGTSTGVEAAFDVGPPAAKRMSIPDVRKVPKSRRSQVIAALDALRDANYMPPAPDPEAKVHALRRELDLAVLRGLGHTAGEASAIAGRCYEDYARWRKTMRAMQVQMEANRSAMNRSGASRSVDPIRRAGRHVWDELAPDTPLWPSSLLTATDTFEEADIAVSWRPGVQEPMFDAGEAQASDGSTIDLTEWERVQYAGALLDVGFRPPLAIPVSRIRCTELLAALKAAQQDFEHAAIAKAVIYAGADGGAVVEHAEALWRRASRLSGMTLAVAPTPTLAHPGVTDP